MNYQASVKKILISLCALSMMWGCEATINQPINTTEPTTALERAPLGQDHGDTLIFESPRPSGKQPSHRQTRSSASRNSHSSLTERSLNTECEAAQLITSTGPALVFNEPGHLEDSLPLSDVLAALSVSNGGFGTVPEQEAIIDSMTSSFAATQMINSQSGTTVDVQARPTEASMIPGEFISQMKPVAVFNRLDLLSDDGSDCGEQRLIFNLVPAQGNQGGINGQFTLIFEARYPNPNPSSPPVIEDCKPIADFWADLVTLPDDQSRSAALRDFFLSGVTVNNVFLPPVINFAHFQGALGQIRTNQFVDSPWQLREFRTDITSGAVTLIPDTNKGNPITALYNQQQSQALGLTALRTDFINDLLNNQMPLLLEPELMGLTNPSDRLVSFEPAFDDQFSGFTSVAQGTVDNPSAQASGDLINAIQAEVDNLLGTGPSITTDAEHVLNRIGAMTCGGCHQFSGGDDINDSIQWPSMGTPFVHVNQSGTLSPALIQTFLPKRRLFLLETFLCDEVAPNCVTDADCPSDQICVLGECIEPVEPGCQEDADCPYGEVCIYNECVPHSDLNACDNPTAQVEEVPALLRGTTQDSQATFEGSCGGVGAEDVVMFRAAHSGVYCFDTQRSRLPTILHLRAGACVSSRTEIGCAQSTIRQSDEREVVNAVHRASLEAELEAGQTYFAFIDSNTRSGGHWKLSITEGPCENRQTEHFTESRDEANDPVEAAEL